MAAAREIDTEVTEEKATNQRLDKWLWFARVIKTRTQAAQLVNDGKVRINRTRTDKPSQSLKPGDVVTVTVRGHVRVLKVIAPGTRRGPAVEAQLLFEEITNTRSVARQVAPEPDSTSQAPEDVNLQQAPGAGQPLVEPRPAVRNRGSGRPTKKDRRLIGKLKNRVD